MAVAPIRPLLAAPLLPAYLAKLGRTPKGRLAIVYRFPQFAWCARCADAAHTCQGIRPSRRDNRLELSCQGNVAERPVAATLWVERLATGGIIGTVLGHPHCAASIVVSDLGQLIDVEA